MDNSKNKNNTELTIEKTPEDRKERTTMSKLGIITWIIISNSIIIGSIVLAIKVWKNFFKAAEGTFFGDHVVLTIALIILLDFVGLILYVVFSKKD